MGRNALTYRQRLRLELDRWRNFRRALLRDERESFDSLADQVFKLCHAGSMYPERDTFDLFTMSALISHERRLKTLEKELRLGMKIDERLPIRHKPLR